MKKIIKFFKSKEITETHLRVLQIISISSLLITLFSMFILPLLLHHK